MIQPISDINDNPPVFSNLPKTVNISEVSNIMIYIERLNSLFSKQFVLA